MRDLCLKFANSTEMEQVFLNAGFQRWTEAYTIHQLPWMSWR